MEKLFTHPLTTTEERKGFGDLTWVIVLDNVDASVMETQETQNTLCKQLLEHGLDTHTHPRILTDFGRKPREGEVRLLVLADECKATHLTNTLRTMQYGLAQSISR